MVYWLLIGLLTYFSYVRKVPKDTQAFRLIECAVLSCKRQSRRSLCAKSTACSLLAAHAIRSRTLSVLCGKRGKAARWRASTSHQIPCLSLPHSLQKDQTWKPIFRKNSLRANPSNSIRPSRAYQAINSLIWSVTEYIKSRTSDQTAGLFASFVTFLSNKEKLKTKKHSTKFRRH